MARNLSFGSGSPPALPEGDVLRLKANQSVNVQILSASIRDVYVHWNARAGRKGRSEPCQKTDCEGCKRRLPRKWLGYLHVWLMGKNKEAFLELPPSAAADLLAQIPQGYELRGLSVVIQRLNGDRARLKCDVFPPLKGFDITQVPPEKEPWDTLIALWNMSRGDNAFED